MPRGLPNSTSETNSSFSVFLLSAVSTKAAEMPFAHLDLTVLRALRTGSVVDHFRTLLSAPAFWLLLDALQHPGQIADVTRARALAAAQKQDFCSDLVPGAPLTSLPTLVADAVYSALDLGSNALDTQTTQKEPALKPYAVSQP